MVIEDTTIFVSPTNHIFTAHATEWFSAFDVLDYEIPAAEQTFDAFYYRDTNKKDPGFFIVELFVAVGKKPITFSSTGVVLRYRGKDRRPVNTYELGKVYDSINTWGHAPHWPLCGAKELTRRNVYHNPLVTQSGSPQKRSAVDQKELLLQADTRYCFALEFETSPPHPGEEYDLEIKSLRAGDSTIPIKIKYVPHIFRWRSA